MPSPRTCRDKNAWTGNECLQARRALPLQLRAGRRQDCPVYSWLSICNQCTVYSVSILQYLARKQLMFHITYNPIHHNTENTWQNNNK